MTGSEADNKDPRKDSLGLNRHQFVSFQLFVEISSLESKTSQLTLQSAGHGFNLELLEQFGDLMVRCAQAKITWLCNIKFKLRSTIHDNGHMAALRLSVFPFALCFVRQPATSTRKLLLIRR
jgi:hypothetical protein